MEVNTLILSKIVFGETSTLCFHGDFLASCDFLEFLKKLENRIHFLIGAPPDCPALILMINPGDRRSLIFCVSKEQKESYITHIQRELLLLISPGTLV